MITGGCVVLLLAAGLSLAAGDEFVALKHKVCKSAFEVVSVEASGCPKDEKQRCLFKHEQKPVIRIGFKPDRDVSALETAVRAKIGDSYVNFNMEEKDSCAGHNVTCPLKAGQLYYYSQSVSISRSYPVNLNVIVHWMLNDPATVENAKYFDAEKTRILSDVCVAFQAVIQEA